ncbi:MAG TPA: lipocalin family protein [Vicinamibacterales bacterium]|jgi:hypothetical protein
MKTAAPLILVLALCVPAFGQSDGATNGQPSAATALIGSWRSGNFMYTFNADGTYVYVGALGGPALTTRSSEMGTYTVSGNKLILARKRGLIASTNGYRQELAPESIIYPIAIGRLPNGPAMQLTYPTGNVIFYLVTN